ncbi:MAG TPA: T9SS type A sorting domain-containing protein [Flavobacteriales bacterium]|nr:T9SS type A sorting domain-containing protein [Flavobacteriales bacterium]
MDRALTILFAFALLIREGTAQSTAILHVNEVQMQVHSNGFIGEGAGAPGSGFSLPNGASAMHSSGLWMGGRTPVNQLNLAAHLFNDAMDFFPGPLTNDGAAGISTDVSEQYDRVWSVGAAEIALHRNYFDCVENPECDVATEFPNGYQIPQTILDWPAMGDPSLGQSLYLAPFVDHDMDGDYTPANGDHPCTAGDGALYVIYNDRLAPHAQSGGGGIGLEVHMMPFAYANTDPFLEQTVFVHYTINNRGTQTLNDFRIGNFADLDIGCSNDDVIGTDVGRNMVYIYNGDDVDDADCQGTIGFGEQPPAFGMVILKGPRLDQDGLDNDLEPAIPAFNGSGYDDGVIDNERHGLDRSMYFNREGPGPRTDPTITAHFAQYMNSTWKDGTPLTYGGSGYADTPGAPAALFAYPGDSDPLGLGTYGVPQPPWAADLATSPQDPRGLAIMGPITLEPGAEHDILIAYVLARATAGGALASVAALQQRVDSVAAFAETIPGLMATGTACDGVVTSGIHDHPGMSTLALYPVPVASTLTVRTSDVQRGTALHVFDMRGVLIAQVPTTGATTTIDLAGLAPGPYALRTVGGRTVHTGRFIKE